MATSNKIVQLGQISEYIVNSKKANGKVVLCHGSFDLLHVGHLHHFEDAKSNGDVLVVTLTADKFILKGPDRPAFNQTIRAEMVAALGVVDFVAIVDDKSAEPAIEAVKPHFYVKGPDYADEQADLTGKIKAERELCELYGGRLIITTMPTYSSSALLNSHMAGMPINLREKLNEIKQFGGVETFQGYFNRMQDLNILFVGETIIDQYSYVDTLGKTAKETHIAARFNDEEKFAGGVIAAANHLADICDNVRVLTTVGELDPQKDVIENCASKNISVRCFPVPDVPTVRKQRYIDRSYMRKMYEVYYMDDSLMSGSTEVAFLQVLSDEVAQADIVIVTDFGHGMLGAAAIELLQRESKFLAVNTQTNSGNRGFNLATKYTKLDYSCLDEPEFRLAAHDKYCDIEMLMKQKFEQVTSAKKGVVTHGKHGCYVYSGHEDVYSLPAFTSNSVDTMGAGDAFFAVTAPMVALGANPAEIAMVGNAAGAQMIKILGHRAHIERVRIEKYIETLLK